MHFIMFRVSPVSPTGAFKLPAWTHVIFLHNHGYLRPIICHVLIIVVDAAIVAIAGNP
jgi:hypothetical protein